MTIWSRPSRLVCTGVCLVVLLTGTTAIGAESNGPGRQDCAQRPLPEIFAQVSPAVVMVRSTSINPYQTTQRVSRAIGSGMIIDPDGLVLTNAHVVFGRAAVNVILDDERTVSAEVVGSDPLFDIALLRIPRPPSGTLPVATLGHSDGLNVGEEVLALGNPLGLDQTVTRGIISAMNRLLPDTPLGVMEPMIQTDAPINPGNSGGPLVNRCGEVIGMTTAILPDAQNIGFAIPIDLVRTVVPALLATGHVVRPWLGVQGHLVTPAHKAILRGPWADGLLIEVVEPGSPAAAADVRGGSIDVALDGDGLLLGGDILTQINGKPVDTPERLERGMHAFQVGETVRLTLFRSGRTREVEVRIPERPLLPQDVPWQGAVLPLRVRQQSQPTYKTYRW